ncbi:MAG: hypothetical protein LBT46_07495 [Planctomycetaceae bacterium]|jgi:hypothetical protein|nr:hypothetical protein [Planctomycetaceae bacterium]
MYGTITSDTCGSVRESHHRKTDKPEAFHTLEKTHGTLNHSHPVFQRDIVFLLPVNRGDSGFQ